MDGPECYCIGYDEDEVISTLYHGGTTYTSAEEAQAHLDTYDQDRDFFRVYKVIVQPIEESS